MNIRFVLKIHVHTNLKIFIRFNILCKSSYLTDRIYSPFSFFFFFFFFFFGGGGGWGAGCGARLCCNTRCEYIQLIGVELPLKE